MALPVFHSNVNTDTVSIYTVPSNTRAVVNINAAGLASNKLKVAITSGGAPGPANWLETQVAMVLGTVLERTGIVLPAGYKVWVHSDTANAVSVQVTGIEEAV